MNILLVFGLRPDSWLDRASSASLLVSTINGILQLVVRKFCFVAISTELFPQRQQHIEHAPLSAAFTADKIQ